MATSQAAYAAEKAVRTEKDEVGMPVQDVSNYESTGDTQNTMKALVWKGKMKVEVVETAMPKVIEDGDVILKVTGTTVCGSDLHLLHGAVIELSKGDILGHEFCGVAIETGPSVTKVQKGKRYVAAFQISCGECYYCKQKLSSQCERANANKAAKAMYGDHVGALFGYSHFTGGFAGGQAEYVRVPRADVNLLEIPEGVPDEKALYLSDVLCTSYHGVVDTGVNKGDVVAIFGAGPIGQMAGYFALKQGAEKVIFVDKEPRLSFVQGRFEQMNADEKVVLVDYSKLGIQILSKETVVTKLKELTNGRGPDVAIECAAGEYAKGWMHWLEMSIGAETDTSEIVNEMIESVRNFGRCGITGVYVGFTNHFNIGSLMQRGIRFIGNGQAPVLKYWEELLEMIKSGELDPLQMLSHRVRLEDLDKVYHKFDAKDDSMQKIFVETKHSFPRHPGTPELTTY